MYEVPRNSDPVARHIDISENARRVRKSVIETVRNALDAADLRRRMYAQAQQIGAFTIAPKLQMKLRSAPSGLLVSTDSGTTQYGNDWTDWIAIKADLMFAFNDSGWRPWHQQNNAADVVERLLAMKRRIDPRSSRNFPRLWKIIG